MRFPFFASKPPRVIKKIKGSDNELRIESATLANVVIDIVGSHNRVEFGESTLRGVKIFIRGNHHKIVIGSKCRLQGGCAIWMEDSHGTVTIGDKTTMEGVHMAVTEPNSAITIGSDCMFAYDIDLRTGDSHAIIDVASGKRINPAKSITLGNHVWVATHCIILKGVEIGDNSIVAAGSVVTKPSAESGVLLAGNPARIVKRGINWSRDRSQGTQP